jgi:hypothetical protein
MRDSEEEPLRAEDLSRPDDRAILSAWRQWLSNDGLPKARGPFYDTLDERLQDRVDSLVKLQEDQPPVPENLLRNKVLDAIARLRLQSLRRQIQQLRFLQDDAQESGDREMVRSYIQANIAITARIRGLERAMNERTMAGRRQREDAAVRLPYGEE